MHARIVRKKEARQKASGRGDCPTNRVAWNAPEAAIATRSPGLKSLLLTIVSWTSFSNASKKHGRQMASSVLGRLRCARWPHLTQPRPALRLGASMPRRHYEPDSGGGEEGAGPSGFHGKTLAVRKKHPCAIARSLLTDSDSILPELLRGEALASRYTSPRAHRYTDVDWWVITYIHRHVAVHSERPAVLAAPAWRLHQCGGGLEAQRSRAWRSCGVAR